MLNLHFNVSDSLRIRPEIHKLKIRIDVIEDGDVSILLVFASAYGAVFHGNGQIKISRERLRYSCRHFLLMNQAAGARTAGRD
jgi:hypothetical protein